MYVFRGLLAFTAALLGFAFELHGQDLRVTGPIWTNPSDAPDRLPTYKGETEHRPEDPLRSLGVHAYLHKRVVLDHKGNGLRSRSQSTEPALLDSTTWFPPWGPAHRDGKPVLSEIDFHIIFNPKGSVSENDSKDGGPRLLFVVSPELPGEPAAKPLLVQVKGTVTKAGAFTGIEYPDSLDGELRELAAKALAEWRFLPARKDGRPVQASLAVPLLFIPKAELPVSELDKPPRAIDQTRPIFPFGMRRANINGEVLVEFVIGVEGRVREAYALKSSHPAFDEPAIEAVLKWRFEPGLKAGAPIDVRQRVPIIFRIEGNDRSFVITGNKKHQEKLPPELRYDIPPQPKVHSFPVYPHEALRDKRSGKVLAVFIVNPSGRVEQVRAIETPGPEFTESVRAMLDTLEFQPAMREGKPSHALIRMEVDFARNWAASDAPISDSALRLLRMIENQSEDIALATKVDVSPRPLFRRPPVPPSNLPPDQRKGEAVIEFYVDKYGLTQLPRVISASDPAFGYSATQAIATWRFEPGRRNGKAVDTRVRIPVAFK